MTLEGCIFTPLQSFRLGSGLCVLHSESKQKELAYVHQSNMCVGVGGGRFCRFLLSVSVVIVICLSILLLTVSVVIDGSSCEWNMRQTITKAKQIKRHKQSQQ